MPLNMTFLRKPRSFYTPDNISYRLKTEGNIFVATTPHCFKNLYATCYAHNIIEEEKKRKIHGESVFFSSNSTWLCCLLLLLLSVFLSF
ncbi:hypothetical protein OIU79_026873 [Salix purpurea]|uniref:Uncharacterized protein n=1 Tax=Salix purpurea TaxID=77065 RepID=A0A9Q0VSE2_SALPP|nr:hypothetical protein OIU79_026873 [Salix purpurea]